MFSLVGWMRLRTLGLGGSGYVVAGGPVVSVAVKMVLRVFPVPVCAAHVRLLIHLQGPSGESHGPSAHHLLLNQGGLHPSGAWALAQRFGSFLMWGLASNACCSQASTSPVWCPSSKISSSYSEPAVESCSKTTFMLCDAKSQFMTPNLDFWFVLHHARDGTGCTSKIPSSPSYSMTLWWCERGAILFALWPRTEPVPQAPWLLGALGCHHYSQ